MSFITTKFQEILLSSFRGVVLTNCFSCIFDLDQIPQFKKGTILRRKKIESKFPVDMHIYMVCPSKLQFHEILLSGFSGVALTNCFSSIFHFGQISKFKKGATRRKRIESKFPVDMRIYTLCPS